MGTSKVIEAYNGGVPFGNSPRATARDLKLLKLGADAKEDAEKARESARSKYLRVAFLLIYDQHRYK